MKNLIFTNKWILFCFFIIIAGACYIWFQYTIAPYEKQAAETAEVTRKLVNHKTNGNRKAAKTPSPGEATKKFAEAEGKNKVVFHLDVPPKRKDELSKRKLKNLKTGVVETTKQGKTMKPDIGVSPYGFGPYPEIPVDFPFPVEWEFPGSDADHEIMARVAIKLWTQGIETMGVTMEEGLVYPNYIDTVYIRWDETTDDDENPVKYIKELGGYPPACQRIVENNIARLGNRGAMTATDIPSDVTVKLYDEAGIDPYSFLNIPK